MNKNAIDSEKFKRFFCYGIENKREVREGLLYISYKKIFESHKGEEWRNVSKEEVEKDMIESTIRPYRQFYRFVTLNDEPEMVDEITFQTSTDTDDNTPGELILRNVKKRGKGAEAIEVRTMEGEDEDIPDVNSEDLKQQLEQEMKLLKAERKILDTKAGLFFARERENLLTGGQSYVYGKGLVGEEGWTKQIYDILEKLEKVEQQDEEEYKDYLLLTKMARLVNRYDWEEAKRIKQKMDERAMRKESERDDR